ncbi:hypothetical protein BX661DRAFT_181034, partial [Kickxella alabastrina]|uniref:uncharacterized protein n=1 Tax=Kickxella alabastrina TaxID=61397 RepID=UPI00221EED71
LSYVQLLPSAPAFHVGRLAIGSVHISLILFFSQPLVDVTGTNQAISLERVSVGYFPCDGIAAKSEAFDFGLMVGAGAVAAAFTNVFRDSVDAHVGYVVLAAVAGLDIFDAVIGGATTLALDKTKVQNKDKQKKWG